MRLYISYHDIIIVVILTANETGKPRCVADTVYFVASAVSLDPSASFLARSTIVFIA